MEMIFTYQVADVHFQVLDFEHLGGKMSTKHTASRKLHFEEDDRNLKSFRVSNDVSAKVCHKCRVAILILNRKTLALKTKL